MIDDNWTPSDREEFITQEKAALEKFTAAGVILGADATESRRSGCTFCQWHAFDTSGEELDGGTASALWGWYRDGYIATATTLRRVVGAVNLEGTT